jgi:isopenicillin-N N-acyltransferase-like protein
MAREITPLVITEGDPYARGRQLGEAVNDRIQKCVDAYFGLFQYHAGLDRERAFQEADRFVPVIADYAPDLLEEMRGIADGAGCEFLEIVAINARTELLHGVPRHECTSIAVAPSASADGHVRIGQNWDWFAWLAGTTVLWSIRKPDGLDVLTFAEAGLVGKIGVNEAGLALCANLLLSDADNPGPAAPMHVILRHVLDTATSVDEAVQHIVETPRCTSLNHLLADIGGAIADVEATPAGSTVIEPDGGVITHANHCLDRNLLSADRGARDYPETVARGSRAASLAIERPLSEGMVRSLLTNHDTAPGSICLHARIELPEQEREESVASILMDLTAGTFDLADGPPCSESYRRIELREIFAPSGAVAAR